MGFAFGEGQKDMEEGRFAEACGLFAGSYAEEASVGAPMMMGRCLEEMGQIDDACVALSVALREAARKGDTRGPDIEVRYSDLDCAARIEALRAAEH